MPFHPLTDRFGVMGQVSRQDVADAAERGAQMIIMNRPDGEEPGQPSSDQVRQWAEEHGMAFRHIPVDPGAITAQAVDQTRQALADSDGRALAFCKSGGRSTALWALARAAEGEDADVLIARAADQGYDLRPLASVLRREGD